MPPPKPTLLGPDGKPISSGTNGGGGQGGVEQLMADLMKRRESAGAGRSGQSEGGYTRAGQSREPPETAGATPGLEEQT
jgi:hypothetical protein